MSARSLAAALERADTGRRESRDSPGSLATTSVLSSAVILFALGPAVSALSAAGVTGSAASSFVVEHAMSVFVLSIVMLVGLTYVLHGLFWCAFCGTLLAGPAAVVRLFRLSSLLALRRRTRRRA